MVMMSINIWVKHKNGAAAAALHLQAMSCNLNEPNKNILCVSQISILQRSLNQDNIYVADQVNYRNSKLSREIQDPF